MNEYEIALMILLYIVWWIICTSRLFLIKGIRDICIFIAIGTIVSNKFELDLIIFALLAFHPVYIKLIYSSLKHYLVSR